MASDREDADSLEGRVRLAEAVLGVVAAALGIILELLEKRSAIPAVSIPWVAIGPASAVILVYLLAYIAFDIWDSLWYPSQGWVTTLGLAVGAVVAWVFLFWKSPLALGYLLCYSLYDGLDAAYYGWFDNLLGPFPGWRWVITSAVIALSSLVALSWTWGAF